MGHREQVLGFLHKIAPRAVSNADIVSHTHIRPHQQVFQITRRLMGEGLVNGHRIGTEWQFAASSEPQTAAKERRSKASNRAVWEGGRLSPSEFEECSRHVMSKVFNAALAPGRVTGVRKRFDLVSEDSQIIGDAKYYTAVNGTGLPPAKFATIAEYVWLLEKAEARERFLVFGNDRRVPEWWLDRYGALTDVSFYYLSDDGELEKLNA